MKQRITLAPLHPALGIGLVAALLFFPLRTFYLQSCVGFQADFETRLTQIRRDAQTVLGRAVLEGEHTEQLQQVVLEYFRDLGHTMCDPVAGQQTNDRLRALLPGTRVIQFDSLYQIDKERSDTPRTLWPIRGLLELLADYKQYKEFTMEQKTTHINKLESYFGKDSDLHKSTKDLGKLRAIQDGPGNDAFFAWQLAEHHELASADQRLWDAAHPMPVASLPRHIGGILLLVPKTALAGDFGPRLFAQRQAQLIKNHGIELGWFDLRNRWPPRLPTAIPVAQHADVAARLSEPAILGTVDAYLARGLLLERKINPANGIVFVAAANVTREQRALSDRYVRLTATLVIALLLPIGIVVFIRRNDGLALPLAWQVAGLFTLTLALPVAVIWQLSHDLDHNLRVAGEARADAEISTAVDKISHGFELGLRHFEKRCERFINIVDLMRLDPEKGMTKAQEAELEMRLATASENLGASGILLIDDACKVMANHGIDASKATKKDLKNLEPLLRELARIKLEINGIPVRSANMGIAGLLVEQAGGNMRDMKTMMKLDNQAFPLKAFGETLYAYIALIPTRTGSNRTMVLVVIGGSQRFEAEYLDFMLNRLYLNRELPPNLGLHATRTGQVEEAPDLLPSQGPHRFLNDARDEARRREIGAWSVPPRTAGITVRNADFRLGDRHYLFISMKPSWLENWCIIVLYDYAGIDETIAALRDRTLADIGFAMAIAVLLGGLFARGIVAPVTRLRAAVQHITDQEYETEILLPGRDELVELAESFNGMARGLLERERMTRYLSKAAMESVRDDEGARMGGRRVVGAVLFSDIRSFTTISEANDPEAVVQLLNTYFARMIAVVHKHEGDIDKFIGDAVMAVFVPAPGTSPTPAELAGRAVRAGLEMIEELAVFNREREAAGKFGIAIGVGVNCGELIAGNIGAPGRMESTVIGDTVNFASRLEGMSKHGKHTHVIVSGAVHDLLRDRIEAERLEETHVKGKTIEVAMYEVVRWKG